jgi:hypothetical protein
MAFENVVEDDARAPQSSSGFHGRKENPTLDLDSRHVARNAPRRPGWSRAPADSLLAQLWALARAVADPAARLSLSLFSLHLFTVHTANSAFRRWHRRRKFATVFFESACNISCLQGSTGVPARNVCPKRFGSHSWQKCLNILRCNFHCESTNKFLCHKTYLLTHANCTENIYTQL